MSRATAVSLALLASIAGGDVGDIGGFVTQRFGQSHPLERRLQLAARADESADSD